MKQRKTALFLAAIFFMLLPVTAYAADGGGHWWNSFDWMEDIANFIKYLVVPPENYFHNRLSLLNNLVNQKFGGLGQLYQTLHDFFQRLAEPGTAELKFSIPNNFLWDGYTGVSFDVFSGAGTYIDLIRGVLTGAFFLFTVIVCYHKIRTFFTEEE